MKAYLIAVALAIVALAAEIGGAYNEFATYKNEFIAYGKFYGRDVSKVMSMRVEFGDIHEPLKHAVGICWETSPEKIVIDKKFWDKASSEVRKILIFHELGHCVLHRDHYDYSSVRPEYLHPEKNHVLPDSIMNQFLLTDEDLQWGGPQYYQDLVAELFITPGICTKKGCER